MAQGGKRWLACGCFGCLGLVLAVLLVASAIGGLAALKVRNQEVEDRVLTQPVGAPAAEVEPQGTEAVPLAGSGRVLLELTNGEFHVEPGLPGEPIRVEARYDRHSFELQETFEPAGEEGGEWTYRLVFRRTGNSLISGLVQAFSGQTPRVHVRLPPDVPFGLELRLAEGGSVVELGGLWLTSVGIDFKQGGFELGVSEPLHEPIERVTITGSMGGFKAHGIGNASPEHLDLDFSMGGMELDLGGAWARDAEITIRHSMGGGVVRLPSDVLVEGVEPPRPRLSVADSELPPPTLRFSVSSSMGELEFY
jgi:hypothetical protein